jgi:hypothetical protein
LEDGGPETSEVLGTIASMPRPIAHWRWDYAFSFETLHEGCAHVEEFGKLRNAHTMITSRNGIPANDLNYGRPR